MRFSTGYSWLAQTWDGMDLVSEVAGLSYDAAKHVAQSATIAGLTGRAMVEGEDHVIVYKPDGSSREGTFAETTIIRS